MEAEDLGKRMPFKATWRVFEANAIKVCEPGAQPQPAGPVCLSVRAS